MGEDEAIEHLLGKVRGVRYRTKELDKESSRMQSEINVLGEMQRELRAESILFAGAQLREGVERRDDQRTSTERSVDCMLISSYTKWLQKI